MTPREGARAPPLAGAPVSGLQVDVHDGRAWVVAFLRGIAGAQARAWVGALHALLPDAERTGTCVVAVTHGPLDTARDTVPRWHVRFPVVVDSEGARFAAWGIPRATRPGWADLDAGALRTHARALVEGRGPASVPDVLPAAFLVTADGTVAWAQVARRRWESLDAAGLRVALRPSGAQPRST